MRDPNEIADDLEAWFGNGSGDLPNTEGSRRRSPFPRRRKPAATGI